MRQPPEPKHRQRKLLAIDGGGLRGLLALRILAKIENILREQSGNPKLVLSDYFDYIGGTSTGGILAAALAIGMSVRQNRAVLRGTSARNVHAHAEPV